MVGDLSVHEFSRQLADGKPTPGGRSAAELGNRFLISDAAVGAELAGAARASAELNVRLNLAGVDNEEFARSCRERLDAVAARVGGRELVDRTRSVVEERAAG